MHFHIKKAMLNLVITLLSSLLSVVADDACIHNLHAVDLSLMPYVADPSKLHQCSYSGF